MERTLDETQLQAWVGRSERSEDVMHVGPARLMQSTLDRDQSLGHGDRLPPLWHWLYFLTAARQSELGRDGHPALGGFLPPVALPRRMWAGSRLRFHEHPKLGDALTRTSTIQSVTLKQGKSGPLCFVTVLHELARADGTPCIHEEHDIVYRDDPDPSAPAPKPVQPPQSGVHHETVIPSSVLLFRYSALTFNGHRIHYDRDYCRDVEGYPGLVFHGPLAATLLADLGQRHHESSVIERFTFRAISPLFDTDPFTIHHDGSGKTWAENAGGGLAMTADMIFRN